MIDPSEPDPNRQEPPVARPTQNEGELHVYSDEDIGQLAAQHWEFCYGLDGVDRSQAEEIATQMYELLTGEWERALEGTDERE